MSPQYLAPRPPMHVEIAALRSHDMSLGRYLYIFTPEFSILPLGYTQVTACKKVRQAGSKDLVARVKKNWRKTCRTVSKHCWPSAWLHWLQPVQTQHRLKSMSWLIPSPSRKSPSTPANTSNFALTGWRAAMWPADTNRNLSPREGAAC